MLIRFDRQFTLPIDEIFSYFRTPADWTRLYGLADAVQDRGNGWVAVPLKSFPFPLVARNTDVELNRRVRWEFRGFWRGDGEVRLASSADGVRIEGYERISVRWLGRLSPLVEKLFLERRFRAIWELGWRRLEQRARVGSGSGQGTGERSQGTGDCPQASTGRP